MPFTETLLIALESLKITLWISPLKTFEYCLWSAASFIHEKLWNAKNDRYQN